METSGGDEDEVALRYVIESDLPIFYEHQRDPESVSMADFPSREREAHMLHWHKIMANPASTLRTILYNDEVAGNIVSWDGTDGREVGYWIGREYWGRGIASRALALLLKELLVRPLFAHVARHNIGSRRVLEKCGFILTGAAGVLHEPGAEPVAEFILRLD
ncbi:MAG TPA: GNAT family N-acetyltransferase [Anaerolineales bacterium]|nr:GNAT family N-acetyltransferase [Anaerolineales bacterium]